MANASKKSASSPVISAAAPVKAAAATVNAVLESESQVTAAPVAAIEQSVRSALEKSMVESRAAFAKAKTAADETANAFEISFTAANDGAVAINAKALEAMRANADANFDFWKAMFSVKSLPDLVALQTEFARKQGETITAQAREFGAMAQKAMADAVQPIKEQAARSLKLAV
jgi:phasin